MALSLPLIFQTVGIWAMTHKGTMNLWFFFLYFNHALLPMKWASISGVWDTTPFNREPLRTRFVVWVSGAECGSRIRPSPAFNGVALIPFLRGTLIICPISQGRWCWSFPNNLLLNFSADWPSSSTAYMLSQGDSTPGPTLERFPISTILLNCL